MARDADTGTMSTGNWAPVREERDDYALPIQGELPRELRGTAGCDRAARDPRAVRLPRQLDAGGGMSRPGCAAGSKEGDSS
jgi:hypothetical protein